MFGKSSIYGKTRKAVAVFQEIVTPTETAHTDRNIQTNISHILKDNAFEGIPHRCVRFGLNTKFRRELHVITLSNIV